jgi:hypothetical protein
LYCSECEWTRHILITLSLITPASRRHGSLRLNLRRKHVFEDSFHAFSHRNADELRGRLHVKFQDEDGVDAGGLSREFFVSFVDGISLFNDSPFFE